MSRQNTRGALELSIGTVVIIVIAMSMLILGLVLVRNIFSGATESVDTINDKIKAEITNIFAEEGTKIAIRLGSDKIAKVKQGTQGFGVAFGAETRNIEAATNTNLKYKLDMTNENNRNCAGIKILDHTFSGTSTATYPFERTEGPKGYTVLVFNIEESAPQCSQRYRITTSDSEGTIATDTFRIQIESSGIFS